MCISLLKAQTVEITILKTTFWDALICKSPKLISLSCRCIWAGRLCVLRVSTSSCWAAGTETASSAHPLPISTPFLPRTPWTWCRERERERASEKHNEERSNDTKEGKCLLCLCILAPTARCGGGADTAEADETGEWFARFLYLYFFWGRVIDGAETHRWFGLFPHQTPTPKAKLTPAFDKVTVRATFHSGWWWARSA